MPPETSLRDALTDAFEKQETPAESEESPADDNTADGGDDSPAASDEPQDASASQGDSSDSEEEIEAPAHWDADYKEYFASLDRKGRELVLRREKQREAGYTKKMQALAEEQKLAENFKKTVSPHEPYLKQLNIDPLTAFDKFVATDMRLRMASPQEKAAIFHDLAKKYGVPLDNAAEAPQIDPQTQFVLEKINKHEEELARFEAERRAQNQQSLINQIQSFASSRDEAGNPKYPHFDSVRVSMGRLIDAGMADSLEQAYSKAVLLEGKLQAEQQKKDQQKREEEARQKAAASKRAGFNVKSGSSANIPDTEKLSLRETIVRAMDTQGRI